MTSPNKVGLVIAMLIGGWHVIWSLLVLVGAFEAWRYSAKNESLSGRPAAYGPNSCDHVR